MPSPDKQVANTSSMRTPSGPGGESDEGSAGLLLVAVPPGTAARLAAAATTATLTITLPPP